MIDRSFAIEEAKVKTVYVKTNGLMTIISDGKNANGKWKILDMAFGDSRQVIQDLKSQGLKIVKI